MVDIILNSRSFDLGYHFSWASIDSEYIIGIQNGENLVSKLGVQFGDVIVEAANAYKDKLASLKN